MPLKPGDRFGSYVVVGLVGAGAMGEVYRARDARLRRDVALKVLPDAMRLDPERLARFEHEARALASLNHPGIAAIYGFEDARVGEGSESVQALVLEFVEGGTLVARIAHSPLPVSDALAIARQIAEALEAAHDKGIVHRDLKPGNVGLTPDGTVKVLDFGLAKISLDAAASMETQTVAATREGVIAGTVAYMSPEQATGRTVDKRTDIWAFGCVLFEMLTGRRLFEADTMAGTLALVMTRDIDWSALPPDVPPTVRALLRRCLERDRRRRIGDAAAIRFALEDVTDVDIASHAVPTVRAAASRPLIWTAGTTALLGAMLAAGYVWTRPAPAAPRVVRLSLSQAPGSMLTVSSTVDPYASTDLALTPDGSQLVYVGNNGNQLFVRAFDSYGVTQVASGPVLRSPFVSPSGKWIGYAERRFILKKVAITGGPAVPLPARLDSDLAGATWLSEDEIVFATFGESLGLRRTTAAPGEPTEESKVLTRPDPVKGEASHVWPEALPGGQAVLFTVTYKTGGRDASQVWVLDLRTQTSKLLVPGSGARFLPSAPASTRGHLVYAAQGGLRAIPFDATSLTTSGTALPVVPELATTERGAPNFAVSPDGTLAYVKVVSPGPSALAWVDGGTETPIPVPPYRYSWVRVAPDQSRLALGYDDPSPQIAIWDIRNSRFTALRFSSIQSPNGPVWTHDSRRLLFQASVPNGVANIWWASADGSDTPQPLTEASFIKRPTSVSPDGSRVVFMEARPNLDVMELALDGTRGIRELIHEGTYEAGGVISPDGRWLAYESDASGPTEVSVCSYPEITTWCAPVTTGGAGAPRWLPGTGRELFFVTLEGALMRAKVDFTGGAPQFALPMKVLDLLGWNSYGSYDVARNGRIVVIKHMASPPEVNVVLNWNLELAQRVPMK